MKHHPETIRPPLTHLDTVSPLRKKLIIYFIGFTAALAGLLFGLDVGVISGHSLF
jgi:hypothetical protein